MNVGVDADQSDALGAIWSAFCTASEKREEDPLSVMRRAHLNGRHPAQSGEKSSAGVGQHIYIGQYYDAGTSLSYLNARYYNGAQGQFTSEDPVFLGNNQNLGDPQSLNAYSYSEDNPIVKEDQSGKFWDFSGSVTIPDIFQPELPGPSFSTDIQYEPSTGHYAWNVGAGGGWGAYASPFSLSYTPGDVPNESGANSVVGADLFVAGASSDNYNNPNFNSPTMDYGVGAGVDAYFRKQFRLFSNLPNQTQQTAAGILNSHETISAYNSTNFAAQLSSGSSRSQAVQSYNSSIGGTYGSSPGTFGYSAGGAPLPNPNSLWTTPTGAVFSWSGQSVSGSTKSK